MHRCVESDFRCLISPSTMRALLRHRMQGQRGRSFGHAVSHYPQAKPSATNLERVSNRIA